MPQYEIIKKQSYAVSQWSGGTTTQVYIYPKDADYSKRNFDFRISSAKVLLEQSDFTPLVGFERYIMPLEGEMHLEHENHHSQSMKPFEQDYFSGAWHTKSKGKCTDFNLMLADGYEGSITCIKPDRKIMCSTRLHTGFFILGDNIRVCIKDGSDTAITEALNFFDFIMLPADASHKDYEITLKGTANYAGIAAIRTVAVKGA